MRKICGPVVMGQLTNDASLESQNLSGLLGQEKSQFAGDRRASDGVACDPYAQQ